MSESLLEVEGLAGGYGASQVLFGVSFSVPARGTVAVLGRNGAGKTTLLRTLLGFLTPTAGTVRLRGRDVTGASPAAMVRDGVGYMPQERVVFPTLTVEENLRLGAAARPKGERASIDEAYALFPKLADRRRQRAGTMSGGERKMVGLARALLGRPELLVLDEPTEGVWHGVVDEILDALRAYADRAAILIVEQHLDLALELADTALVLQRGEIVMSGRPAQLRDDQRFLAYLTP
ncbi:MAG: ABC transporter ATP-binding protein [Solirubrobacteraceae bacterium]|nr:ABC transporter ATP-binding protein [Solirubrobacteraceae bacterium]